MWNVNKCKPLIWLLGFNSVCKFCPGEATRGEEIAAAVHFLSSCPAPGRLRRLLMEHSKG